MKENIGKYIVVIVNNDIKGILVGNLGQIIGVSKTEENSYIVAMKGNNNILVTMVENQHMVILKDMFTLLDMVKMYEAGQDDCGEFGRVRGFDEMFNEIFIHHGEA